MDGDPVAQAVVTVLGDQVVVLLSDLPEPVEGVPLVLVVGRVVGEVPGRVVGQRVVVPAGPGVVVQVAGQDLVDLVEGLPVIPLAAAGVVPVAVQVELVLGPVAGLGQRPILLARPAVIEPPDSVPSSATVRRFRLSIVYLTSKPTWPWSWSSSSSAVRMFELRSYVRPTL